MSHSSLAAAGLNQRSRIPSPPRCSALRHAQFKIAPRRSRSAAALVRLLATLLSALSSFAGELQLPLNSWVKLSPLTNSPPSPRLGYEGACAWDAKHQLLIRYGGHNQGGGGEQHSETWTFDPLTARWTLKEPNAYPPGICCGQQNVFDPAQNRYLRFPSFSGSHGWQWWRKIYLNDSSVWSYDPDANKCGAGGFPLRARVVSARLEIVLRAILGRMASVR